MFRLVSAGSAKSAATAAATHGRGRAISADRLAAGLVYRPVSIVTIAVIAGAIETVVVAGAIKSIVVVNRSRALTVQRRIVGRSSSHARTVKTATAAAGKAGAVRGVDQSVIVGYRIKGPQVRIDARSRHPMAGNYTASVVRIVEIRIIPAVPHKIAVPGKIRVPESKTVGRPESHPVSHPPISRIPITITSGKRKTAGRRIVGIISAVVVEIRPALGVLRLHADIIVAGGSAVVFVVTGRRIVGSGPGSYFAAAGRIINIVGVLCIA